MGSTWAIWGERGGVSNGAHLGWPRWNPYGWNLGYLGAHIAQMGPIWVEHGLSGAHIAQQNPGGPHLGPVLRASWDTFYWKGKYKDENAQ